MLWKTCWHFNKKLPKKGFNSIQGSTRVNMSEYSTLHGKFIQCYHCCRFLSQTWILVAQFLTFYILLHSTGNHTEPLFTRKNKNSNKRFQYVKSARIIWDVNAASTFLRPSSTTTLLMHKNQTKCSKTNALNQGWQVCYLNHLN